MEVAAKEEEEEVEKGGEGHHSLGAEGSGHLSLRVGAGGSGHLGVERRGERADELRRRRVAWLGLGLGLGLEVKLGLG